MRDEAVKLKAEGLTVTQIAARLNAPRSTVGDWVKRHKSCPKCGREMGNHGHRFEACRQCLQGGYATRRAEMVRLRRDGLSNVAIAQRLGTSAAAVANVLCRERERDPSIPASAHYLDSEARVA
jgi:transposase